MESRYKQICRNHNCKAKVFTKVSGKLRDKIGNPDLIVLFTSTVAHKMVNSALDEAIKNSIPVHRARSSSVSALEKVLQNHCH